MTLRVTNEVATAIRAHGRSTYPHECCGALIGRAGEVAEALALPNTTEEGPRRRFLVRPDDYRTAESRAAATGAELLGFYHSHPDHPAVPSQYDLDHAWPFFSYVIVSVAGGVPAAMRSWRLREDRSQFDEETLEGRPSSGSEEPAAGSVEAGTSSPRSDGAASSHTLEGRAAALPE